MLDPVAHPVENQYFEDMGYDIHLGIKGIFFKNPEILFGADTTDTLLGNSESDHLYGMVGNDLLIGDSGGDYLEGGEGDDTLIGNSSYSTAYRTDMANNSGGATLINYVTTDDLTADTLIGGRRI